MLLHVWPGLDFWFYLAIISSPSWVFSFSAMDFVKKTSGLVFIFLISTLTLLCCAGNLVLSYFYLHPQTNRFFRGYECAGKTIGFVLVVLGNVGLCYFPEKSVACILTFLFLAFYCLCALFCIQPYTGFGALEFLLTASLNPTLRRFGLPSPYSWLVIIACIVIAGIRFTLQPVHPPEQATSDEGQRLRQLEAGLSSPPGARLDNNPSPSDIIREPAPAGGPTNPLLQDIKTYNEDPSPPGNPQSGEVVLEDEDEPKEWMAQVEPGVQVTFESLPHGGNDLRRIRFSREMFNKWQAQRWWGENFDRIMELYNVQRFNRQALHTPPRSEDERDSSYSGQEYPMTPSLNKEWTPRNYNKPSGSNGYFPTEPSDQGLGHHYNPGSMDASRTTTSSRDEASVSISNASDMETEWVEQDEPGVYITIRQLADGTRELRRVRFSRERFGEMNARLWWEENRKRIQSALSLNL
ncbi:hypothetical protein Vadar_022247 [Vaccinium darrowii]|uniref:Uncharacterized protein n=1 Tax=Vaccinium darrowii TaxID=229202 RepID=A0ACB7X338_9ERIC|nr:hypothetical protein Vadar_022247 [Vaccinium darrowii]